MFRNLCLLDRTGGMATPFIRQVEPLIWDCKDNNWLRLDDGDGGVWNVYEFFHGDSQGVVVFLAITVFV